MSSGLGMFIVMGVILKIPVAFACWLVWWAMQEPDPVEGAPEDNDGGQRRRFRREPKRPQGPRRGPHSPNALPLPCPEEGSVRFRPPAVARPITARHDQEHRGSRR